MSSEGENKRDPDEVLRECRVTYMLSPGPGGQRRDRKRTAVRLHHNPTGIVVMSRRYRYRSMNLRAAIERLMERLEERSRRQRPRIPTRVPRAVKERVLKEKKLRSAKKRLRKKVNGF